jgi:hypothetical protein
VSDFRRRAAERAALLEDTAAAQAAAQAAEIRATGRVTVLNADGGPLVLVVGAHRGLWALTKLVNETSRRWALTHLPTGRKLPGVRIPKAQAGRVFAMWFSDGAIDPDYCLMVE